MICPAMIVLLILRTTSSWIPERMGSFPDSGIHTTCRYFTSCKKYPCSDIPGFSVFLSFYKIYHHFFFHFLIFPTASFLTWTMLWANRGVGSTGGICRCIPLENIKGVGSEEGWKSDCSYQLLRHEGQHGPYSSVPLCSGAGWTWTLQPNAYEEISPTKRRVWSLCPQRITCENPNLCF